MDEVETKIIEILRSNSQNPLDTVSRETALEEMEIASLDLAVIIFELEDAFGIEIPFEQNDDAMGFDTVGAVIDKVRDVIKSPA